MPPLWFTLSPFVAFNFRLYRLKNRMNLRCNSSPWKFNDFMKSVSYFTRYSSGACWKMAGLLLLIIIYITPCALVAKSCVLLSLQRFSISIHMLFFVDPFSKYHYWRKYPFLRSCNALKSHSFLNEFFGQFQPIKVMNLIAVFSMLVSAF